MLLDSSPSSLSTQSTSSSVFAPISVSNNCDRTNLIEIEKPSSTYSQKYCIVCRSTDNRNVITDEARLDAFIRFNLFIPKNSRGCKEHFLNNRLYTNCYETISIISNTSLLTPEELMWFLNKTTNSLQKNNLLLSFNNRSITSDSCKSVTGLTESQFFDLVPKLKSIRDSQNRTKIEAIVIFLSRLKTNLSLESLATFFSLHRSKLMGNICNEVETAFLKDMTPYYVGCRNLTREILLSRQSKLAKILIPHSELILICDGTYAYHQKSSNNLYQRKSYSMHKHANLCKPFTICTTDGFIVQMFGPYLATSNDATIMKDILNTDNDFLKLLKKGDCFVVDRGFRDVVPLLEEKGFVVKMPA